MSRLPHPSAVLAASVIAAALLCGTAEASTPRGYGPGCAGSGVAAPYGRLACRPAHTVRRGVRTYRRMIADARLPMAEAELYGAGRYLSLLILGVGY